MHKNFQTARWRIGASQGGQRFLILLQSKANFQKWSKKAEIFMVVPYSILMKEYVKKFL